MAGLMCLALVKLDERVARPFERNQQATVVFSGFGQHWGGRLITVPAFHSGSGQPGPTPLSVARPVRAFITTEY